MLLPWVSARRVVRITTLPIQSHHTQRVSLAIVKGEGDIVAAVANRLKADQVIRDCLTPLGA